MWWSRVGICLIAVLALFTHAQSTTTTSPHLSQFTGPSATPEPASSVPQTRARTRTKSTSTVHGGVAPFKTTSSRKPTSLSNSHTRNPSFTRPPPSSPSSLPPEFPSSSSHSQSGWIIFLEAAGALVGLGFAAALARCFWSYRKTPRYRHARQDGIQQIRRELRESRLARVFNRHPPPPYEYAPEYECQSDQNAQIYPTRATLQESSPPMMSSSSSPIIAVTTTPPPPLVTPTR